MPRTIRRSVISRQRRRNFILNPSFIFNSTVPSAVTLRSTYARSIIHLNSSCHLNRSSIFALLCLRRRNFILNLFFILYSAVPSAQIIFPHCRGIPRCLRRCPRYPLTLRAGSLFARRTIGIFGHSFDLCYIGNCKTPFYNCLSLLYYNSKHVSVITNFRKNKNRREALAERLPTFFKIVFAKSFFFCFQFVIISPDPGAKTLL